jgi:hypothetical protein
VVYVHAQNTSGWGPFSSAPLNVDKAGPVTSGLSLVPSVSNGVGSVVLNASGSDATTGGGNVISGDYTVDGVAPGTLAPNGPVAVATALQATIPVGSLTEGAHVVSVTTTDSLFNVSALPSTINLIVDRTGPVATPGTTTAAKNPTNGIIGVSSGVPAVRITSTFTDGSLPTVGSNIAGAEGFIDVLGTNGGGFVFTPSDGVWGPRVSTGTNQDTVFADIPLATVAALPNGTHTIFVHAKDAAGNWGAADSVVLLVDKAAPTFTVALTATSVPSGTASVTMNLTGSDNAGGSGIAAGEYWFGTAGITVGTGTAFTGMSASIPVSALAPGTYTIQARLRDVAGNWSVVHSATLVITYADAIFANGFETGPSPWGWSSTSTNTAARLNRANAAALVGSFGLQAQGNNTNYVQWNFPTGTAVSTYDAKFSFRPNGNISAGKDIFVARTATGTTVFRVRYRLNGTTPQVQIQVGTANTNTAWTNVNGGTAVNTIQVVWQANVTGGLKLYVNGTAVSQFLNATNNTIGSVRLGSVTITGDATLMFFDNFASKRLPAPLL